MVYKFYLILRSNINTFKFYIWQENLIKTLKENDYIIVKKPRKCGFSTVSLWIANEYSNNNKTCAIICLDKNCATRMKENYINLFGNSNAVHFTTIKEVKDSYNFSVDLTIIDELAFFENQEVSNFSYGKILIGSTPSVKYNKQRKENIFYKIWRTDNEYIKLDWNEICPNEFEKFDFQDQPKEKSTYLNSRKFELSKIDDNNYEFSVKSTDDTSIVCLITKFELDDLFKRFLSLRGKESNFTSYCFDSEIANEKIPSLFNDEKNVKFLKEMLAK